jgi:HK97 family phage prohead protease
MTLHNKIKELQLRAAPITASQSYVDKDGNLVIIDLKQTVDVENRTVKGYLAVFGIPDTYGTVAVSGCFAKSIRDRGPESNSKQKIAFLWQHDPRDPIGQFTVLREDEYGLYFEAVLDDVPSGERALRQIKSGTINQFSYGFDYIWDKMEYDEKRDVILMYEVNFMEGSPVTFGSMAETYAIRSTEDFADQKNILDLDTEDFISGVPRAKQLELRQLIARHISLAKVKPHELRQTALDVNEPIEQVANIGGYKLNLKQL